MKNHFTAIFSTIALTVLIGSAAPISTAMAQAVDLNPKIASNQLMQKVDAFEVIIDATESMNDAYKGSTKFNQERTLVNLLNDTIPNLKLKVAARMFGQFKAFAELVPGANDLVLKTDKDQVKLALTYKPQTNPYKVRAVMFTDKTGDPTFETPFKDDQDYRAKWDAGSFEYGSTPRRFDFPPEDARLVERLVAAAAVQMLRVEAADLNAIVSQSVGAFQSILGGEIELLGPRLRYPRRRLYGLDAAE